MAAEGRRAKIARVRLVPPEQPTLFADQRERVINAFVPGTYAERYGRTWRMGQVQLDDDVLIGRIGFATDDVTEVWDPESKDFRVREYPTGTTSPFALRVSDLEMVFQTRGTVIRVTSFVGAMQALIRAATNESEWLVETTQRKMAYATWQGSVDRVVRVRFHIERPNPNYQDRPRVEELMEGVQAAVSRIEFSNPDGLLTDSDIVSQLVNHVERGYGDATLVGERATPDGQVEETTYVTRIGGESELSDVPADEHGDVSAAELRAELGLESHEGFGSDGKQ